MTAGLKEELNKICSIILEAVDADKVYLFGSYAYGMPDEYSDYDICVIIPDGDVRPVDAVRKIRGALYSSQTMPLDIIVYRACIFEERRKSASLERKIAGEGVLLYERKGLERAMA